MIDTHCHLSHIEADPASVVADAQAAGVETIVDIGLDPATSADAVDRATTLAPFVYAAVGVHPNDLEAFERDRMATMGALRELARRPRVVGIGETGLDRYRDRTPHELQEEAFRAHIALAREVDLALVVHCRDAHDRVLEVLSETPRPPSVVMHCFSGDVAFAEACAAEGFFCSFAGNLTYRRSDELRAAAASVPIELLLVETDAPYLAPEPRRGRPNHPELLPNTVAALAEVRGVEVEELVPVLDANSRRAFSLPADER